jgi:hypothetical protein
MWLIIMSNLGKGDYMNWWETGLKLSQTGYWEYYNYNYNHNTVALVRKRTIPTEQPPLVGEVSVNFVGRGCRMVSATDPYSHILGFLDCNRN